ncbi:MAG: hypothetical protein KKF46_06925 [Nanoarchaeota archaeon]|nr:hypothetical protein [Nanoarchaeota archaeon]MBU1322061.1 hypothetical protein [Nanoarchaeota archaeon]MBU1597253.1 hypothetical protein [Nanoarchaeota archaeon]MBU2440702.1 hypothetical protein [Nanoarchaeota archaeon]
MFKIKISIRPSQTHGIGIFAEEKVSKDSVIHVSTLQLDVCIIQEEFELAKQKISVLHS